VSNIMRHLGPQLVLFGLTWLVVSVAAGDQPLIYSGGRGWPVAKSATELTVRIKPGTQLEQVRSALAARGAATARLPLPPGPRQRLELVTVATADQPTVERLAGTPNVELVTHVYRFAPAGPPVLVTDTIIVGFDAGLAEQEILAFCQEYEARLIRPVGGRGSTYLLRLERADGGRTVRAAAAMYADRRTRFSHPDLIMAKRAAVINDPLYADQWHLNDPALDADINAPEAWISTAGAGATIAIYDDAIDIDHPDLTAAVQWAWDYGQNDNDPSPLADENHGTAVAGVAVAQGNDIGVRGSAPSAGLIAQRWGDLTSDDVDALHDADSNGADVHSNSWSYSTPILPDAVRDEIVDLYVNGRGGLGLLVIFAAGNEAGPIADISPIAAMHETLAVGASTNLNGHAGYSNTGPELDLVAPSSGGGLAVVTTDVRDGIFDTNGYSAGDYTDTFGGTSSATPLVAGAAALCLAANPNLKAVQLRAILEHTCDQIGTGYGGTTSHSENFGYGKLNAAAAVAAATTALGNGGYTWPDHITQFAASQDADPALIWVNPPEEVASVMIVRAAVPFDFKPVDGTNYSIGQTVAVGAEVVYNDSGTTFTDTDAPEGDIYYAAFVRNDIDRWSWGNTTQTGPLVAPPTVTTVNLAGPIQIDEQSAAQYQAIARLSNGSTLNVTDEADWSAWPTDVLTSSSPGQIQAGPVDADTIGEVRVSYTDEQSNTKVATLRVTVVDVDTPSSRDQGTVDDVAPPAGCCGAAEPVTPLALVVGLVLLGRSGGRHRRTRP